MAGKREPAAKKALRRATTPEARENQLTALALDEIEKRLLDGTISNSLLAEIYKRGTVKAMMERDLLAEQTKLAKAKTDAYQAQQSSDEKYAKAIEAMRRYNGHRDEEYENYEDLF